MASKVAEHGLTSLVLDPVMVAKSGDRLLQTEAVDALRRLLIPLAMVITPNVPEAEVLTGREISDLADAREAACDLVTMGAQAALVKGGHLPGASTDVLYDGEGFREYTAQRIETTSTHGTGCTLASAIAAGLAKGMPISDAVAQAKDYVTEAIRQAFPMGRGHGPLNHFYMLWESQ